MDQNIYFKKVVKCFATLCALLFAFSVQAQVGIGTTTPDASAQLEIYSNSKGLLAPRMTAAQRNAISSPANGLLVYQTNEVPGFYFYNNGQWQRLLTNTEVPTAGTGVSGNSILNGAGNPVANLGRDGDFYINLTNHTLYGPKVNGAWPSTGVSIVGPVGPQGPAGSSASMQNLTGDVTSVGTETTIGAGRVTEGKLADGAVTRNKIADNAINSDKLNEGAVTAGKIGNGAVTEDKIASNAVTTGKIANGAVTNDKIAGVDGSKVAGNISGNAANVTGIVGVANGGTGASNAADARTNLGLGNVDNTRDADKPVSTATQAALNTKEDLVNKSTNIPADAASDQKYPSVKATKTYVDAAISTVITPDATTSEKGKVQLSGDLTGVAAAPRVAEGAITRTKIADNAVNSDKIADGSIRDADLDKVNIPLSGFGRANAQIDLGGNHIINLRDPSDATDAVNKRSLVSYVDGELARRSTGAGGVISVSVSAANGLIANVTSATTTPMISLGLGNITPSSVAATGAVTGSNLSGTNTGDQTAATVPFTPIGSLTATNLQAALEELESQVGSGAGAVTGVTVSAANGFTGSVINTSGTSEITLGTTVNGLLYGSGGAITQATTTGTGGAVVLADSPVLNNPTIGTAIGNITGNAATVTTNANLTGPVTSIGNATSITDGAITATKLNNITSAGSSGQVLASNGNGGFTWSSRIQSMVNATDGLMGGIDLDLGIINVGINDNGVQVRKLRATQTDNGRVLTVVNGVPTWQAPVTGGGGTGTVTSVSVSAANGFTFGVTNPTTTPALALGTSVTGILQGDGSGISAAPTTGTGPVVLGTSPTLTTPTFSGTATGNISGTASNVTGIVSVANGGTGANNAADARTNLGLDNVATLGPDGKIPSSQIPPISFSSVDVVNSEAAMLALGSAVVGSTVIRTDESKSYVLAATPASDLTNWKEILTPGSGVQSVNGQTGTVSISKGDLGLGNVENTADANKNVLSATRLSTPRTINGVAFDGTADITIPAVDNTKVLSNAPITAGTHTKITYDSKGLVTAGTDATTADIADSANKRYVTDAQLTTINNTSGTNTGDQTATTVPVVANGQLTSTDVQAALEELQAEIVTAASGGLTAVAVDGTTITGNGNGTALSLADQAVTTSKLRGLSGTGNTGQVLTSSGNGEFSWTNPVAGLPSIDNNRLLGNISGSSNAATGLTATEVKTMLSLNNVDNTSDVNKPISTATQNALNNKISTSQIGVNNGVAPLDNNGLIPSAHIPPISFSSVSVLNNQADMLALPNAVVGSTVIRTDESKSYVLAATPASDLNNWKEILTPNSAPVQSVNGEIGTVNLTNAHIGLGNVQNVDQTNASNLTSGTVASGRLPIATSATLGAVRVGSGLTINATTGELSATAGTVSDATTSAKGIVQLAGDLGGTAAAPIIANNAVTTDKISNNAVTLGKLQTITANRLLGAGASGTAVTEITLGTGLSLTGTTLNATGGATNLGYTPSASTGAITSSTGTSATIPAATSSAAGLLTSADKTKLDGLNNYTLPIAAAGTLGGVRVGTGLSIDGSGVLSVTASGGTVSTTAAFTGNGSASTPLDLANSAVTSAKIADGTIAAIDIANQTITATKLSNITTNGTTGQVLTSNGAGGFTWSAASSGLSSVATDGTSITGNGTSGSQISVVNGGISTVKIADGAVSSLKLADNAVTSAKIVDGTIATVDIASGAVTNINIADQAITARKLGGISSDGLNNQVLASDGTGNFKWVAPATGGATNLAYTASATQGVVTSDTGNDATIPAGSTTNASLMLPADKAKLDRMGDLTTTGLVARTGNGTAATRTITNGTGISVTNGDGVSGNPTVALANTAVTPGSYTSANITVDAQGRITAATNGTASGGGGALAVYSPAAGVMVKSTGTGVTYSITGNVATITIPAGVIVHSIRINQTYAGIGNKDELEIWITDNSVAGINTNKDTFMPPQMSFIDRSAETYGAPTPTIPYPNANYGTAASAGITFDIIGIGTPANTLKTRVRGLANHTSVSGFSILLNL